MPARTCQSSLDGSTAAPSALNSQRRNLVREYRAPPQRSSQWKQRGLAILVGRARGSEFLRECVAGGLQTASSKVLHQDPELLAPGSPRSRVRQEVVRTETRFPAAERSHLLPRQQLRGLLAAITNHGNFLGPHFPLRLLPAPLIQGGAALVVGCLQRSNLLITSLTMDAAPHHFL